MTNQTRHALDNLTDAAASSLDNITKGLGEIFGDLGSGLVDYLNELSGYGKDKDKDTQRDEKGEALAKVNTWSELETGEDKRQVLAAAADYIKGQSKPAEQAADSGSKELVRERVIEVPHYIKAMPEYEATLARQREQVAKEQAAMSQGLSNHYRMEAYEAQEQSRAHQAEHEARQDPATPGIEGDAPDFYAQAAEELNAKPLEEGQEVEGEVMEVRQVGEQSYYVMEQEGERLAVPAGDSPEFQEGDEITVMRTNDGFETTEAYGYGR